MDWSSELSFPPYDPNQPPPDQTGQPVYGGELTPVNPPPESDTLAQLEALHQQVLPPPNPLADLFEWSNEIDYRLDLDDPTLAKLGRTVCEEIERWWLETEPRRAFARTWRRDHEMLTNEGPQAWSNSAAARAPFTSWACTNDTVRLNEQIIRPNPMFGVKARKADAQAVTSAVEDVLQSKLEEARIDEIARQVHTDLPIIGNVLVRVTWKREVRRAPSHKLTVDEDKVETLHMQGLPLSQALLGGLQRDRRGRAKRKLKFEERVIQDGIELAMIPWERMILLPVTATHQDECWGMGEVVRMRGLDLQRGADEGRYIPDAVEFLLRLTGDPKLTTDDAEWMSISGVYDVEGEGRADDPLFREYICYELAWFDDLDGDGRPEWYILGIHRSSQKVFRVQYSPYEHGQSHYVHFPYLERPQQLLGAALAERISVLQDVATSCINSIVDLTDILKGAASSFIYGPSARFRPGGYKWQPGTPIFCQDPNAIKPLPVGPNIPQAIQELMKLLEVMKDWTDRLSSTSDTNLGQTVQSDKTLGEVKLALGQSMAQFGDRASGVANYWKRVANLVRWTVAQYSEHDRVEYRVSASPGQYITVPDDTGQPQQTQGRMVWQTDEQGQTQQVPVPGPVAFGSVPSTMLTRDVDLVPSGIDQMGDRGSRLQRDVMVNSMALAHPVLGQMPDVLVEIAKQLIDDITFPNREKILQMIDQNLQKMQAMQAAAAQLQQMQQTIGLAQQGQSMQHAQEQHATGIAQIAQQIAEKNQAMGALGMPTPNGSAPAGVG